MKNFHSDYEEDEREEWQHLQTKSDRRFNVIIFSIIFISLFCMAMVLFMLPSRAQEGGFRTLREMICLDTKMMETILDKKYHEEALGAAVTAQGNLIRLFSSGTTYTIIETRPTGASCILSVGGVWEVAKTEMKGTKS